MKEGGSRFVFIFWLLFTAHQLSRDKMEEKGGKKMEDKVCRVCVHWRLPPLVWEVRV